MVDRSGDGGRWSGSGGREGGIRGWTGEGEGISGMRTFKGGCWGGVGLLGVVGSAVRD